MSELIIKLKQHTPIIHFQHYQEGATLRASELKPKLDKFLIENFDQYGIDYRKWLIGTGKHPALNYKVKIIPSKNVTYYLPLPLKLDSQNHHRSLNLKRFIKEKLNIDIEILAPSPFFANSDKIKFNGNDNVDLAQTKVNSLIFAVYSSEETKLKFTAWDENLLQYINDNISLFFLTNNFGTRQDKGFGSFTVSCINGSNIYINKHELKSVYIKKSQSMFKCFNDIFQFILDEYQLIKSGKNYPNYHKSKLFEYFIQKHNILWEKRFIKQKINSNKILNKNLFYTREPIDLENSTNQDYNDWKDHQKNNYAFVRALLGLAEQYEFLVDNNHSPDKKFKYIVSIKHKPEVGAEIIERFPSPIFFKVIDNIVYLGINDTYKNILNEEFEFKLRLKGDRNNTEKNLGSLKVPSNFDLKDFITKYLSVNWTDL